VTKLAARQRAALTQYHINQVLPFAGTSGP
jgi:hypothetical protein